MITKRKTGWSRDRETLGEMVFLRNFLTSFRLAKRSCGVCGGDVMVMLWRTGFCLLVCGLVHGVVLGDDNRRHRDADSNGEYQGERFFHKESSFEFDAHEVPKLSGFNSPHVAKL